jgi:RNA polymerase sigma factor (sigma-70 family)
MCGAQQQTLLEVWRRGHDYDPKRASLATWLLVIARSRAIDHLRRRVPEPVDSDSIAAVADRDDETGALLERWRMAGMIAALPREETRILRLRFYEGLSQREIAERTGTPLGTRRFRRQSRATATSTSRCRRSPAGPRTQNARCCAVRPAAEHLARYVMPPAVHIPIDEGDQRMPTYIMLTKLTPEGIQTIKNNPARIREVNTEVAQLGAEVKAQWATLGEYDFVNVIEAPDEKTIARVSLELGSRGTSRYETLTAIPIDDFIGAL